MYLRRRCRNKGGIQYESWALVESVRTARGPRQRTVVTVGKLPGLDAEEKIGWEEIGRVLDGKPAATASLFEKEPDIPYWATVSLKGIQVERLRHFGDVYLGLALWKRLGLEEFCEQHIPSGREDIQWSVMAAVLSLARFCAPSSELQIADSWYSKTALDDLLGVPSEKINDDRLYRALDVLLPHKDTLCRHLQKRYGELFGTKFDFLIYDITSTYFEGTGKANPQAKRGYSRDSRPDCVQVCIGLVASVEGLPLAFEVFDGNRTDVTTVEEMVELMQTKYGKAERVWVMDRGMVSEENIESLQSCGARYLVGTPKSMLRKFEHELIDKDWQEVQPGVEVKLCPAPDGTEESFVLCRSEGRKDKGTSLQKRLKVIIKKHEDRYEWLLSTSGSYLLRTNWKEKDPKEIWNTYIQLTQVEDAFRTAKSDLGMRPIYHHKADRMQAHILVCFLALVLWRTLQQWMECSGLGTAPRKLIEELREIKSLDVLLPSRDNKTIRLRVVSTAPPGLKILLQRLKLPLPNRPKVIENVVPTFADLIG